ncbi:MAG: carbohydrate-binding family 9-like protein [Acidobacteria bacterium]|nr:carbohydrate-binding family 9-like protein [Acidobacteriota bacterium]MCI0626001.1 carbohydrate-binding family 9-like protein [Acidobacteriota bacterium]MCI0719396.1 carbohydrate-binding family 9-like protein [Acidobacteriota bacterium]
MFRKSVLGFLMLTGLAAAADKYTEMQDLGPLPEYVVRSIKEKIVVDGKLSEPAWSQAAPITLLFPWDFQTGGKQKTTVSLVRDSDTLYVGYEADDTDITATHESRDDPTYKDDCVEIFIKPSQETDSYLGMEMNARGVLYDYFFSFPKELDKALNFEGVQLKTTLRGTLNQSGDQDKGWTLEVAIPFKNFARLAKQPVPKTGEQWRVQINRWDGTEASGGRRLSMWCHSGLKKADPHNPERFGILIFK